MEKVADWDAFRMELVQNFRSAYLEDPRIEQVGAWKGSLQYLARLLSPMSRLHDLALLEYRLPFSGERIDFVLLGMGQSGKPLAYIVELKGWRSAANYCLDFVLADGERRVNPEYQLRNYIGKIVHSHSASELFDVDGSVLIYNLTRADSGIALHCSHFYKGEEDEARRYLQECFDGPLDAATADKFVNGQYTQSTKLFDAVNIYFDKMLSASNAFLAQEGYGLSTEQLSLVDEIIESVRNNEHHAYFIRGAPGSGKTLVALHLLLRGLAEKKQTVLAYRNNRLIESLKEVTNEPAERVHIDVPIKFYSTGRPWNPGLAEPAYRGPKFNLAIFDEAQRMKIENIDLALLRGTTTVFLYDESQILNADEEGTERNFLERAASAGVKQEVRRLEGVYRVQGGRAYHEWVETLLSSPGATTAPSTSEAYDFRVFSSPEGLFNQLRAKRAAKDRVALVAAFTETPGDSKDSKSDRNIRIAPRLPSGLDVYSGMTEEVHWLMNPKIDYVPFWVKGGSDRLDRCASIYGCQGFEVDYAGVIWGRDFVVRRGQWEVGDHCEDGKTGRPPLKRIMELAKSNPESRSLALQLLKNRYRIFLTRGIKGTYLFCEDAETTRFFQNLTLQPPPLLPQQKGRR